MTSENLGLDDESGRAQLHHPGQTERADCAEVYRSENGYAGAGHSSARFGKRQLAMRSALLCGMSLMMSACDAFVFVPVNVSDCRTGALVSGAVVTATIVPRGAAAGAAGATKSVTGTTDQHGDVRRFIHHPAPSDVEIVVRAVEFSATRRSAHVAPRQAEIRVCMLGQGG